jgi:hypothetical protein
MNVTFFVLKLQTHSLVRGIGNRFVAAVVGVKMHTCQLLSLWVLICDSDGLAVLCGPRMGGLVNSTCKQRRNFTFRYYVK